MKSKKEGDPASSWADRMIEENLRSLREAEEQALRIQDALRRRVYAWVLDPTDGEPDPPWRLQLKAGLWWGPGNPDDSSVELGVLQLDPWQAISGDIGYAPDMGPLMVVLGYIWDRRAGTFRLDDVYLRPLVAWPTLVDVLDSVWGWIERERSRRGLFWDDLRFIGGPPAWVKALELRRRRSVQHAIRAFLKFDHGLTPSS